MSIKWGSFYTVVRNLEKHGLIEAAGSSREGRRPERTLYAITAAGKAELTDWLHELVAVPEPEPSRFVAALSVIAVLPPDEVAGLLAARLRALEDGIARDREGLAQAGQEVPRIFLIESEFELAMGEAQAAWVRGLLGEITGGTLPGVQQWRHYHASGELPAQYTDLITKGLITKGEPPPG
jgi:DNA-binding PadR family transcriptional regulator